MARISTYIKDTVITGDDFVIGSDGGNANRTSQFSVDSLASFINANKGFVHVEDILYGDDIVPGVFPVEYFGDVTATPPIPPTFPVVRVNHGLGNTDIIAFVLEKSTVSTPPTVWVNNDDGELEATMVDPLYNMEALRSIIANTITVIDDNNVDIDFGVIRRIEAKIIIIGPKTSS